jgi:hypothetical protein
MSMFDAMSFFGMPIYIVGPPKPKVARRRGARGRVRSKKYWSVPCAMEDGQVLIVSKAIYCTAKTADAIRKKLKAGRRTWSPAGGTLP